MLDRPSAQRFRDAALPHLDATYSYALFLTRNEADARDAVQDCYLLAMRHFGGFRDGSMRAWLRTILRNVCYADFTRRARREQPAEIIEQDECAQGLMWQETQATPEEILHRRQEDAAVRRLVSTLPPALRQTLELREFHGLSYQEIARVSRAPIGTVMSRLARAREALKARWISAQAA